MAVKPPRPLSAFEHKIRSLARERETSPAALGVAANLSKSTIQKWIDASYTDQFDPSSKKLKDLADYCGVTVDWLLDGVHPTNEVPTYEPSQGDLARVAARLRKRGYPADAINEVLLTHFDGVADENDVLDAAEAELSSRGYAAKFGAALGARETKDEEEEEGRRYAPSKDESGEVLLVADSAKHQKRATK